MPERIKKLAATVRELEAELETLETVDTPTRKLLEEAVADLQAALKLDHPDQVRDSVFGERLQEVAERFETSHPTLFGILSRTIDALGQMGI